MGKVRYISIDIHHTETDLVASYGLFDVLFYPAWPGLPHYDSLSHF